MPIHEYQCEKCGEITEKLVLKKSDEPKDCPKCHGKVHQIMSNTSFILKGSGWYATDYANKGKPKPKKGKNKDKK